MALSLEKARTYLLHMQDFDLNVTNLAVILRSFVRMYNADEIPCVGSLYDEVKDLDLAVFHLHICSLVMLQIGLTIGSCRWSH